MKSFCPASSTIFYFLCYFLPRGLRDKSRKINTLLGSSGKSGKKYLKTLLGDRAKLLERRYRKEQTRTHQRTKQGKKDAVWGNFRPITFLVGVYLGVDFVRVEEVAIGERRYKRHRATGTLHDSGIKRT